MVKKSNDDWMKEKLVIITDIGAKVNDNGLTTDYGNYSALKLISVNYYADIFSGIVRHPNRKPQGFDGAVYVDLFAGTGLVKLTDSNDLVGGSVPCAALNKNGFNYCVCVEIDHDRCKVLKQRLSSILNQNQFDIIEGDCNDHIDDVITLIKRKFKKPILFTFVDPEGMEIKFSTLKKLSDAFMNCDFMINVTASGIARVAGKLKKGISGVRNSLEDYLDDDASEVLRKLAEGQSPEKIYQDLIMASLGKPVGDNIAIHDEGKKIVYHLLGYTRLTRGGSTYGNAFSILKRRIEWADRKHVKNILDLIHGRTSSILDF